MLVKTHLITISQHDSYIVKWLCNFKDCNPIFTEDGKFIFIIISNKGRMEIETLDLAYLEESAKKFTYPKGQQAITTDIGYIYLKEHRGKERLLATVTHNHIRDYAPMFDDI